MVLFTNYSKIKKLNRKKFLLFYLYSMQNSNTAIPQGSINYFCCRRSKVVVTGCIEAYLLDHRCYSKTLPVYSVVSIYSVSSYEQRQHIGKCIYVNICSLVKYFDRIQIEWDANHSSNVGAFLIKIFRLPWSKTPEWSFKIEMPPVSWIFNKV